MTYQRRTAQPQSLASCAALIRKDVLDISYRAHVGHIGPALSVVDILTVVYVAVLRPKRDRFILSKGHAAAALFATLARNRNMSRKTLLMYCQPGGVLGDHPDYNPALGIELTTGSLGHGLSVAAGMAIGLRPQHRVFVLLSDAELNEGSVWEAAMFAAHHKLANLTAIIDNNGRQAFGKTADVLDTRPLDAKWKSFGWDARVVDGHNHNQLCRALTNSSSKPVVVIANTIAGYGVRFMEGKVDWHYWPMSEEQYKKALNSIQGG